MKHCEGFGKDIHLAFDETAEKFRLMLFGIPLESVDSGYVPSIGTKTERVGGYQIVFPLKIGEKTWALALLFSVDPESGELTSKFNFAYDVEKPTWRHVIDLHALDVEGGKILEIKFELTDYDQTARVKWDSSSGKLLAYEIGPGAILESIMGSFLSKDYFSEQVRGR
ncbi:MAG: hypothetical protein ACUVQY_10570 [Thermoproteota archaeon]